MERLTDNTEYCTSWADCEMQGRCAISGNCYERKLYNKLREYEDAEEQGMIPRFHLGDELWSIRLGKVLKSKIVMIQQKKDGTWQYRLSREITLEYHDTANYKESDCGNRFFLTREEAEAALERMNNNG